MRVPPICAAPIAALALFVLGACGAEPTPTPTPSPTPTPTATPTPTPTATPTPTPTPTPALITVDPEEDPAAFLQAIPAGERGCLEQAVGVEDLEQFVRSPRLPPGGEEILRSCVSKETIERVVLGQAARGAGGLDEQTVACLQREVEGIDLFDFIAGGEASAATGGILMRAVMRCLSDEELARTEMFGHQEEGAPSVEQFRCLFERLDPEALGLLAEGQGAPPPEVMDVFIECGIPLGLGPGERGGPPPLSAEQEVCLTQAVGEQAFQELMTGQRPPTAEELAAAARCGIPIG